MCWFESVRWCMFDLLKYALTMESAISTIPRATYLRTVQTLNSIKSKIIV